VIDTGSIELKSYLVGYTQGVDYKAISTPTLLYDRYELLLSRFQISILDYGLPKGMKSFVKGEGNSAIKEFTAAVNIFNCLEPMHPRFPTIETAIVIKNFEVILSIRFLDSLLRIKNAVLKDLDQSDDEKFRESLKKKIPLQELLRMELASKVRKAVETSRKIVHDEDGDTFYDMIEEHLDNEDTAS